MKGRKMALIAVLMILFSIGGSTYGMAEETVALYPLIITAMVAAGFDTLVAVATVLLGAGAGVLGSTVNPFATGVAMDALNGAGAVSYTHLDVYKRQGQLLVLFCLVKVFQVILV